MMTLVPRALAFATAAHGSQVRKYTGEPYINHAKRVAAALEAIGAPDFVVAAGLLHDVLEDTPVTASAMRAAFGSAVTDLVLQVTDVSTPADGNRAARKALDLAHLAKASAWGQTIKLADIADNGKDIEAHDPKFAKVWLGEKKALLAVLTKGNAELYAKASACL
jgi:(p)ppGpp synthase/HD superfamily hydrolase